MGERKGDQERMVNESKVVKDSKEMVSLFISENKYFEGWSVVQGGNKKVLSEADW